MIKPFKLVREFGAEGTSRYRVSGAGPEHDEFQDWMVGRPVLNRKITDGGTSWVFAREEDEVLFKLFWYDRTYIETVEDVLMSVIQKEVAKEIAAEIIGRMPCSSK